MNLSSTFQDAKNCETIKMNEIMVDRVIMTNRGQSLETYSLCVQTK